MLKVVYVSGLCVNSHILIQLTTNGKIGLSPWVRLRRGSGLVRGGFHPKGYRGSNVWYIFSKLK